MRGELRESTLDSFDRDNFRADTELQAWRLEVLKLRHRIGELEGGRLMWMGVEGTGKWAYHWQSMEFGKILISRPPPPATGAKELARCVVFHLAPRPTLCKLPLPCLVARLPYYVPDPTSTGPCVCFP